jgi:PAS domain S-box-containing protein
MAHRLGSDVVRAASLAHQLDASQNRVRQGIERLRLVVEASPTAMVMVDASGVIDLVNAQTETVFGYGREEMIGQPVEMLMPERYRSHHPKHRADYFRSPQRRSMGEGRELFGRRKDGSEVPVEIGLNPIQTRDDLFVLASIVDVTERRQVERDTARQRNELAHLSRVTMLGELSGSLAHELNQPLMAILSNAQAAQRFLAREEPELQEVKSILKDIVDEDKSACEVIYRLQQLFRMGEVQQQPLEVNDVVREVMKLLNSDLVNHMVSVQTELGSGLPRVRGDRVQLQQVLINLIMNACDAMGDVSRGDRKLAITTEFGNGDGVHVSVADRGCGIPPDRMESVFEPFVTAKKQGMGLGLTVCRTIVLAHGGKLWAANNSNGGATFHLTLPALR